MSFLFAKLDNDGESWRPCPSRRLCGEDGCGDAVARHHGSRAYHFLHIRWSPEFSALSSLLRLWLVLLRLSFRSLSRFVSRKSRGSLLLQAAVLDVLIGQFSRLEFDVGPPA